MSVWRFNMVVSIIHWFSPAGVNGKFWYVSSSGLVCSDGDKPEDFFLEFVEHGRIAIKGSNGKYLRGDQGGTLMGDGTAIDASSLWEYWSLSIRVLKEGTRCQGTGAASSFSFKWSGLTGNIFLPVFILAARCPLPCFLLCFFKWKEVDALGRYVCFLLWMLHVLSFKWQCQHKTTHIVRQYHFTTLK